MAQPYIYQQDDVGPPGRFVSLVGLFPGTPVVRIQRIDGSAAPAEASASTVSTVTSSSLCVQFQVPNSLSMGLFAVWVKDGATVSATKYLNRAVVNYVEYDQCVSGTTVMRVFGRNLKLSGATPTVRFVNGGNSFNATVDTANSSEEVLRFTAPSGLTTSTAYTLYVSNGHGGTYGEVNPISGQTVTARAAGNGDSLGFSVPWAGDFVYTVRSTQTNGASATTINSALTSANGAGGGVVVLPAGTFGTANTSINIPSNVILKGAGIGTTTLLGNIQFTGTTLMAVTGMTITSASSWGGPAGASSKVVIHNVASNHSGPNNSHVWEPKGVSHFVFSSWTQTVQPVANRPVNITASGSNHPRYLHIRNCTFRYLSYRWHLSDQWYATIENTTINGDFTLGAYRITDRGGWNCEFLWYSSFIGCTMTETGTISTGGAVGTTGIRVTTNDGESLNWQGGSSHGTWRIYQGTVTSATGTTITDSGQGASAYSVVNANGSQYSIFIIEGTGKGQFRDVTGVNSGTKTLTVSPAWDVNPDSTSVYLCERIDARSVLIKSCPFTKVMRGLWFYTGGYDLTIADNTFDSAEIWLQATERDAGTFLASSGGSSNEVYPHWKSLITRNTLTHPTALTIKDTGGSGIWRYSDGIVYTFSAVSPSGTSYQGTYMLLHSIVGNSLTTLSPAVNRTGGAGVGPNIPENITIGTDDENNGSTGLAGSDNDTDPQMAFVIQSNTIANATAAYSVGTGVNQVVIADKLGSVTSVNNITGSGAAHSALNKVEPTADTTAPVVSAVASSGVTSAQGTVTWTTDEASDTQVEWGPTTSYGSATTLDSSLVTSHSATITGLSGGTTYHYRVKSRDAAGNLQTGSDNSFTTVTSGGSGGSASTHRDGAYSDAIMDQISASPALALYWPMDETAGSTCDDAVSTNDGTIGAGVTVNQTGPITSAPVNKAFTFDDSTNASVIVAAPTGLPAGSFTIDVWAKHAAVAWDTIAGWTNGRMVLNGNGEILVDLVASGSNLHFYAPEVTVGQWGHYTFAYDSTAATGKLYINGALVFTASAAGANAPAFGSGLRVGKDGLSGIGSEDPFNGQLARFQLYSGALSDSTIAALDRIARSPSGYAEAIKNTANLISYWRMGETSGTTLVDSRGPNNLGLTATYTLNTTGAISGDANGGVRFPSDGHADVSSPTGLPTTGSWTMILWVLRDALGGYDIPVAAGKWRLSIRGDNDLWIFESTDTSTKRAGNDTNTTNNPLISAAIYHMVALGRNGTAPFIYVDGVARASIGGDTLTAFDAGFTTLRFGQDGVSGIGGADTLQGNVDEAAVFGRALSGAEITALYLLGRPLVTHNKRRRLLLRVA